MATRSIQRLGEGAFQLYTVLIDCMTSLIPSTISFEQAAVIPLGASTASCGLFQRNQLALQLPFVPRQMPTPYLGGATIVGCNAVAARYEVITTCSPQKFKLMKRLGASRVFDNRSQTAAGALTMSTGAVEAVSTY